MVQEDSMTKVALITGASSGIGLEFARQLDADPDVDEIWLVARNEDKLKEVAKSLATPSITIPADLTSDKDIASIKSVLSDEGLEVSYLVNSAGFGKIGPWDAIEDEQEETMIDLNCRALVTITRACLPHMGRGSRIIQIASVAAFMPVPDMNVYAATKAFVLHYSRALRFEVRSRGISVTALCPAWVKTNFQRTARKTKDGEAVKDIMFAQTPDVVVRRALAASRRNAAVCCAGAISAAVRILTMPSTPPCISMAVWNAVRKL